MRYALKAIVWMIIGLGVLASQVGAATIFVDRLALPDGDGQSWETAFIDLQDALDLAQPGDSIWLTSGTYRPTRPLREGDRRPEARTFLIDKELHLFGGFEGDEMSVEEREVDATSELDGQTAEGANVFHVLVVTDLDDPDRSFPVTIDGFEIRDGRGANVEVTDTDIPENQGAGILMRGASATIRSCWFDRNESDLGGGIYVSNGSLHVEDTLFFQNEALDGGAMMLDDASSIVMESTTLTSNTSSDGCGGIRQIGGTANLNDCGFFGNDGATGGAYRCGFGSFQDIVETHITMTECVVSGSEVLTNDVQGAVSLGRGTTAHLSHCEFDFNITRGFGAAIAAQGSDVTVDHSAFCDNIALSSGWNAGGAIMLVSGGSLTVNQCAFADNMCAGYGGAIHVQSGTLAKAFDVLIENTTFFRNSVYLPNMFGLGGAVNIGGYGPADGPRTAVIRNCDFIQNQSARFAGALAVLGRTSASSSVAQFPFDVVVERCRFLRNEADIHCAMAITNSLYPKLDRARVSECLFAGNAAQDIGGVGTIRQFGFEFRNCVAVNNTAHEIGGLFIDTPPDDPSLARLHSCVFWDNTDERGNTADAQLFSNVLFRPEYSVIQNAMAPTSDGVTSEEPLFVDADGPDNVPNTLDDDYRAAVGSSAIDAGDPLFRTDSDAVDPDGNPRIAFCRVDAGVFESQTGFVDCDANGVADGCDIQNGVVDDCNADGIVDDCQLDAMLLTCPDGSMFEICELQDCDANGVPDACQLVEGFSVDCNENGILDACELGDGADINQNGQLDICECDGDCYGPDSVIDIDNLIAVIVAFGHSNDLPCSLDNDGVISFGDILQVINSFGPCKGFD
ncbi:MAG: hypothetical protein AAF432_13175 [Planctomycetota bacterium]